MASADRASREDQNWMSIALGMLQPGLRRAAGRLVRIRKGDLSDIDSEFLTGVIEAVATIDLATERLASRLITAGINRVRRTHQGDPLVDFVIEPQLMESGSCHPEMALWRAVDDGAISAQDAELIASTRLDSETFVEVATRYGISADTLRRRRNRAERRLCKWVGKEV